MASERLRVAKLSKNSMCELAFDSCVSIASPVLLSLPSFHLTYLTFFFFSLYCYLVCGAPVL
jgi:ABC-type dipeptide/oligopeptide/nickel transport system permease component